MVKRLNHTLENMQEIKHRKWDQLLAQSCKLHRTATWKSHGVSQASYGRGVSEPFREQNISVILEVHQS